MPDADARISPTAHYTSYVWFKHGMSHEALTSTRGRVLYHALRPLNIAHLHISRGANLEMMLLARHRIIDHLLTREIESGRVRQVIEIASGLSPRGFRFARRHASAGLRYIEGDLPEMAGHKRAALVRAGLLGRNHEVLHIDARAAHGPASVAEVAARRLDAASGTAIITEGLTGYIDRPALEGMWARFARVLAGFGHGVYLADLVLGEDARLPSARAFTVLLGLFVRGRLHLHYHEAAAAAHALGAAGFGRTALHTPAQLATEVDVPGGDRAQVVRIIEAIVQP